MAVAAGGSSSGKPAVEPVALTLRLLCTGAAGSLVLRRMDLLEDKSGIGAPPQRGFS